MDIRGGGDGGTSHTKNPNQIFPIIYTLSSKYLCLSLARAHARTLFSDGTYTLRHEYRRTKRFEATTKATSRGNQRFRP